MSEFDPQRARGKRPLPIWMDAFVRDTLEMEADEVGAYFLILGSMWSRRDCSIPKDARKIARIARVSQAKWRNRIGPAILPLLQSDDEVYFSARLRKEAVFVQISVTNQHCRRTGENSAKLLKGLDWGLTTDKSADKPRSRPTQQPNNLQEEDKSSSKKAEAYQKFLKAHPRPIETKKGEEFFNALLAEGISSDQIIAAAAGYAQTVATWSDAAKVQQSDNFLDPERGKWLDFLPEEKKPAATKKDQLSFWADLINSDRFVAPSSLKPSLARALLDAGLVTRERLRDRGIAA